MLIDFEDIKHKLNNSKWYGTQAWCEILDIIGNCDDKSRPKGEWILECDSEGEGDNLYRCSKCGCRYGCQEYDKPNYCLVCGAEMRGE